MHDDTTAHYDAVIARQHARIAELEAALSAAEATLAAIRAAPMATQPHHQQMLHHAHQLAQLHRTNYHTQQLVPESQLANAPPVAASDLYANAQSKPLSVADQLPSTTFTPSQTQTLSQNSTPAVYANSGPAVMASQTRYWTELEHNRFLRAVQLFGPKNYVAISNYVGSRTPKQVRSHSQKYQLRLEREARKRSVPPSYYNQHQLIAPAHHALLMVAASEVAEREARENAERELKRRRRDDSSQSSVPQSASVSRSGIDEAQNSSHVATSTPRSSRHSDQHVSQDGDISDDSEHGSSASEQKQQQSQNLSSVHVSFAPRKRRPWRTSTEGIAT